MKNNKLVYYIDPQSYSNLAIYDYNLIERIEEYEIVFWGNELYDYKYCTEKFVPIFKYSKKRNSFLKGLSYLLSLLFLLKNIFINRPKIIHIQWIRLWFIDVFLLLFSKLLNIRVVFTAHNVVPHDSGNIEKYIYSIYYKMVDRIVVHVQSSKQELESIFHIQSNKISVIPHGILEFSCDEKKVEYYVDYFKKKMHLENKIVFSIIGSQSYYKGSDIVISMWKNNKYLHNDKYQLIIAGRNNGLDFTELVNIKNVWIDDNYISEEKFHAYRLITSVMLMPYRKISQSGVLLSIIKERIPFIVTKVGGLGEILLLSDVGWGIDHPSVEQLSNCVQQICNRSDEIKEKRENILGWKKVEHFYDWGISAQLTSELYNKL